MNTLITNIDKLHTTDLGIERIKRSRKILCKSIKIESHKSIVPIYNII